jgi:hypothetical protein
MEMDVSHDFQGNFKALLQRQHEIQDAMRRPGGIRITVERELQAIREQLRRYAPQPSGASVPPATT